MASVELQLRVVMVTFRSAMATHPGNAAQHVERASDIVQRIMESAMTPDELSAVAQVQREIDAARPD